MSKYCPNCGRQLPDAAMFCDQCGTKMPDLSGVSFVYEEKPQSVYFHADTMSEAAEVAIARNESGRWSYWSSPDVFFENAKKVRRFCEKEDKRLKGDPDQPRYIVSASGAIGDIYRDEDGMEILEWVYLTEQEGIADLPSSADDPAL